jgi:hypothetical protein
MIRQHRAGRRTRRGHDRPSAAAGGRRRLAAAATISTAALALAAGALAPGAPAAGAATVTLAANRACYVNTNPHKGAPMTITGSGFAPGDPIQITGGTVAVTTSAGATGSFSVTTGAPTLANADPGTVTTKLKVTDTRTSATTTIAVTSANLAVATIPTTVKDIATDKVTYTFSGFTPGREVHAYYRVRGAVVAATRFGRAAGPCGTLRARALLYPGGHPRRNTYDVTFESSSRFSKTSTPRVDATLSILAL